MATQKTKSSHLLQSVSAQNFAADHKHYACQSLYTNEHTLLTCHETPESGVKPVAPNLLYLNWRVTNGTPSAIIQIHHCFKENEPYPHFVRKKKSAHDGSQQSWRQHIASRWTQINNVKTLRSFYMHTRPSLIVQKFSSNRGNSSTGRPGTHQTTQRLQNHKRMSTVSDLNPRTETYQWRPGSCKPQTVLLGVEILFHMLKNSVLWWRLFNELFRDESRGATNSGFAHMQQSYNRNSQHINQQYISWMNTVISGWVEPMRCCHVE